MKICIFVGLLFAGLVLGLMAADIETSTAGDVSSVTVGSSSSNASSGGAVAGAEVKDSGNRTSANVTVSDNDDKDDAKETVGVDDDKDDSNVTISDDKDDSNVTISNDKDDAKINDDKVDSNVTTSGDKVDSNVTSSGDKVESNVTLSSEKNESHHESEKTDKRHAVYGTYYVNAPQQQQQQFQRFEQDTGYEVSHNRGYADTIPGVEGKDYPIFSAVPPTSFSCSGRDLGLYGDVEARCQVWHNCQVGGHKDSFLCPNGTLFNQQVLVCDWWYNVECETTPSYYGVNAQLIQQQQSYAGYKAYPQQISRYQASSAGNNGYYFNSQKPFYVQTTTYPTGYYFNTGNGAAYTASGASGASYAGNAAVNTVNTQGGGAYSAGSGAVNAQGGGAYNSGSGSYAAGSGAAYGSSAAAAAGTSFVSSTNNLNSGSGSGYYYRPSYQSTFGSGSSLGGYGYTVSGQAQTPGYVTMRYDIPGGQYASGQLSGAQATGNAGFQYSYSTGQLPGSLAVPTPSNTLQQVSQAHRVRYTQRLQTDANGDRPDHPNYNEKSGYNYRAPQSFVPTATIRAIPAPPPAVTQRVETLRVVQPQISVPIQPIRPLAPIKEPIDHPNANEKSGYNQPRVPVTGATVGSQKITTNYAFNSYNAPAPAVKQTTTYTAASQNAGSGGYSSYNAASQNVGGSGYSSYNAAAVQPAVVKQTTYTAASQSSGNAGYSSYNSAQRNAQTNYQFSTYQGNQSPQYPVIQGSSGAQFSSSGAQSGNAGYSYSNYNNRVSEAVHPNANEKSGYVQQKVTVTLPIARPLPVAQPLPLPVIRPKAAPSTSRGSARHSSYSFSTYNADHPNINEKSSSRISLPVIATTYRPAVQVVTDPIDHPNYREKSGYNPRPYIGAPIPTPRPTYTRLEPPTVQVDCAGYTNCRPGSNAVKVQYVPERQEVYANFGQRIEAAGVQAGATSGSMAASDRSAAPAQGDNSYY